MRHLHDHHGRLPPGYPGYTMGLPLDKMLYNCAYRALADGRSNVPELADADHIETGVTNRAELACASRYFRKAKINIMLDNREEDS